MPTLRDATEISVLVLRHDAPEQDIASVLVAAGMKVSIATSSAHPIEGIDVVLVVCRSEADLEPVERLGDVLPVVVIADDSSVTEIASLEAGAVAWMPRPADPTLLPARIVASAKFRFLPRGIPASGTMERELWRTTELLTTVLANAPMVVFAIDREGVFTLSEGRLLARLGLKPGQAVGRSVFELHARTPAVVDAVRRAMKGERVRFTGKMGEVDLDAVYSPRLGADGEPDGVLGVARDVTEERKLAAKLTQSQKMEAIGLLAGGVAHDFNNLLTLILSAAHLIDGEELLEGESADDLRQIIDAASRASELTRQLLAFGRRQSHAPAELDVTEVVRAFHRMLRRLIRDDVTVTLRCTENLPPVLADPSQLDQVLLNLVVNAQDAMPRGGNMMIRTGTRRMHRGEVPLLPSGHYAFVEVEDDGVGMSEEVLTSAFEPFFTTKAVGEGTGLGLSTCHDIARTSGGTIVAKSTPGEGSVFTLLLPVLSESEREARAESGDDWVPVEDLRGLTILLVEDDPVIRTIIARSLERENFRAVVATDGKEALDRLAEEREIALVLTDIVMPHMGGIELAERANALGKAPPFLFMSGYTDDMTTRYGFESERAHLIRKPFTPDGLVEKVRDVLARSRGPAS